MRMSPRSGIRTFSPGSLGQTAVKFPPMQESASFDLSRGKEEIDEAIKKAQGGVSGQ